MLMEYWIILAMWIFGFVGFILFIPRYDWRKGFLAFLMFQAIIWLCDMPSFQIGLLSAPVREFPTATDLPITIDYFFYPVLFSIYYVNRKVNGLLSSKIRYFFIWTTAITLYDILLERYTDLLKYEILPWYGIGFYMMFMFYISQICCNRFYRDKLLFHAERWDSK
jgi:hypothetical protein